MTITLYATAVSLLVVGVLWAEARIRGLYADNALVWARAAWDEWQWRRHDRARNAAAMDAAE